MFHASTFHGWRVVAGAFVLAVFSCSDQACNATSLPPQIAQSEFAAQDVQRVVR